MFVWGFFWSLSSHWRYFHSYGDDTIAVEWLQILTYDRHSWPLSSVGSLMCHTHCDTGISEDPWHSHLLPNVWQWSCHYLFLRLRSVATGDRTPISRMRGERSTSKLPRRSVTLYLQATSAVRYSMTVVNIEKYPNLNRILYTNFCKLKAILYKGGVITFILG